MNRLATFTTVAAALALLAALAAPGPSDVEAAQASALNLQDAVQDATQAARQQARSGARVVAQRALPSTSTPQ